MNKVVNLLPCQEVCYDLSIVKYFAKRSPSLQLILVCVVLNTSSAPTQVIYRTLYTGWLNKSNQLVFTKNDIEIKTNKVCVIVGLRQICVSYIKMQRKFT